MKKIIGILSPGLLALIVLAGFPIPGLADLDERGFAGYEAGGLNNQHNWSVERCEKDHWLSAPERVEVVRDTNSSKQYVKFMAGYWGKDQTRIVKQFPATDKPLVIIALDFQPGASTVGGRLHFDQAGVGSAIALMFVNGTVQIQEEGLEKAAEIARQGKIPQTDTGAVFEPDNWNNFELRLNFETHKCEVFLNRTSLGVFEMSRKAPCLNQMNFYAGGSTFASLLGNISIVSVDKFPETKGLDRTGPQNKAD